MAKTRKYPSKIKKRKGNPSLLEPRQSKQKNISTQIRASEISTDNNVDLITELPSISNVESSCLENCTLTHSIFTSTPINSAKLIPKQLFKPSASFIVDDKRTEINNSLRNIEGRRFVNIGHIFESIQSIKHVGFDCTFSDLEFPNEIRKGFFSIFVFTCKICGKKENIYSENPSDSIIDINMAVVSAVINTGQGYTQLEEFAATLNMPMMSNRKYQELHTSVFSYTHKIALEGMIEAGKEGRRLAIERGDIDERVVLK